MTESESIENTALYPSDILERRNVKTKERKEEMYLSRYCVVNMYNKGSLNMSRTSCHVSKSSSSARVVLYWLKVELQQEHFCGCQPTVASVAVSESSSFFNLSLVT